MASNSAEVDSDATISDTYSSDVPVDEIPPPVLDAQEEEVAVELENKEVEVPQVDSDATISNMSSSDVPVDKIPPPVLDAQEEEVGMEQRNKEVELPDWLKKLTGDQEQHDWKAFAHKRKNNGHIDRTYMHKDYCHKFRSKPDVELFVESKGFETGIFKGTKLRKKKIAGIDAQDAGTSKSARRRASGNHARPKRSLGPSRSMDVEEMARGFP